MGGVIAQNSYRDVRDVIMDVENYQDFDGYIFEVDLDKTFVLHNEVRFNIDYPNNADFDTQAVK